MIDYFNITGNNNALVFPDTEAINSSGPLALDGTEIIAAVINDLWGANQALLDFYNMIPSGVEEDTGVDANGLPISQRLAAMYVGTATPGKGVTWWGIKDPFDVSVQYGIDVRILLLEGQGVDRTMDDYKILDFVIYVGDANNGAADAFYHADDAGGTIRNIAGNYLILPDTRGLFLRDLDPSGLIDPDGVGRFIGDIQNDEFEIHNHSQQGSNTNSQFGGGGSGNNDYATKSVIEVTGDAGGDETRPKNITARRGIYY